jgi:RNA polymerase primary sigma factor
MKGPKSDTSAVAERLRAAIELARPKLKKKKLAARLEVSPAAVSHWLSGKRECPTETLREIATITKVDPTWLLLGSGVDPRRSRLALPKRRLSTGKEGLKWRFRHAPADGGKDFGNAGVYATPMAVRTVVREDGQNALDAGLGGEVTLRFRVIELDPTSDRYQRFLTGIAFQELTEHVAACESESKIGGQLVAGLEHLREEKLVLLAVDDYGTTGLLGDEFDSTQPYCALVRDNLNSRKSSSTSGGIFGVGAKVNLACSRIGTVFFASKVHKLESRGTRLVGRSELTYHDLPHRGKKQGFAGPGWFGSTGKIGVAESIWLPDNHEILDDLLLRRDRTPSGVSGKAKTGTSLLIVGFADAQIDLSSGTKQLAEQIVEAVAVSFWPAIMKGHLTAVVERYVDDAERPVSVEQVDPKVVAGIAPYCEAFDKFAAREEDPSLAQPGDVVVVPVPLTVPATRPRATQVKPHEELTSECKLVVRLAAPDNERSDPRLNDVAYVRGRAMVTRYQNKGNVVVGGRPFHAILLAGTMLGRTAEHIAIEEFLRLAEPPAHDKWAYNTDVAEVYARGSKRVLDEFFDRVVEQLQRILRPIALSQDQGPEILNRLFLLRSMKPAAPRRPRATLRSASGAIQDGAWVIEAEVSIEPVASSVVVTPILSFEQEGGHYSVRWAHLDVIDGTAEVRDGGILVPPRTKRITFKGASDPASHPVEAGSSAVFVDVVAKAAR